jgi:hypothetical protein
MALSTHESELASVMLFAVAANQQPGKISANLSFAAFSGNPYYAKRKKPGSLQRRNSGTQ